MNNLIQILNLEGNHYQMGYQHGHQVLPLRSLVIHAVEARLAQIQADRPDETFVALVERTRQVLETADPPTLAFIRGQADGLELDFEWLLNYSLVNFLRDALTTRARPDGFLSDGEVYEGCSVWAASGSATTRRRPILVKNRDYRLEHLVLQVVVRARPARGYPYLYITSAGNPGVFVAGLNQAGLAVADTHVPCPDVGPGLPTFALSMHLLEEQHSVPAALAYLQSVPRLGRNNLVLADAGGNLAVFENGHSHSEILETKAGFLVCTNHFNSEAMRGCFVDTEPKPFRGNTYHRYQKIQRELSHAYGRIGLALARRLMSSHDGPLASLCRHPEAGEGASTISNIILLPSRRRILYGHGQPCQSSYRMIDCLG